MEAFEKHIKDALPDHPSSCYLIASPHDFERKKWMDLLVKLLRKKGECDVKQESKVEGALIHLKTKSLFASLAIVVLDQVDELSEKERTLLSEYLKEPSPLSYLILGAATLKQLASFYDQCKKELVIFDLTAEKSWQREKRLKKFASSRIASEGKRISPEGLDLLFGQIPLEMGLIEQELNKILCYVGEKKEITLQDISAISCFGRSKEGWQRADELIWKAVLGEEKEEMDSSTLFGLIGQMRYYLEKGLMVASLVEKGKSLQEISEGYAEISHSLLEKFAKQPRGVDFFKKGLLLLFELELSAKNSSSSPELLLTIFYGKLYETDPTSQSAS